MSILCLLVGHKKGKEIQSIESFNSDYKSTNDFVYLVKIHKCTRCGSHLMTEGFYCNGGVRNFILKGVDNETRNYIKNLIRQG